VVGCEGNAGVAGFADGRGASVIEGTGPHDAGARLAAVCGVATCGSVGCYRCTISRGPNEGPGLCVRAEAVLCYVMLC